MSLTVTKAERRNPARRRLGEIATLVALAAAFLFTLQITCGFIVG